jgi:hypothetical protein
MDNKFFTFIKPYLSFIDNGHFFRKPFVWLYTLLAAVNLIFPIYIFYKAVDNNIFEAPVKSIIVFLIVWIIIAFASWVSFQLWWDRKQKVTTIYANGDDFVAIPVFSHFIQTMGEWLGTWIGIVGFSVALLGTLLLGDDEGGLPRQIGAPFLETGFVAIVKMPIYGFLIVVFARSIAEVLRALASIANNTKKSQE